MTNPDKTHDITAGPVTAYYDGHCPICRSQMHRYAKYGRHLVILHDCTGDLPADIDRDAALAVIHVRLPNGQIVTGWNGFIAIWERLPGWHILAKLTRPPCIRLPLDWAYRLLAPWRPRTTCRDEARDV